MFTPTRYAAGALDRRLLAAVELFDEYDDDVLKLADRRAQVGRVGREAKPPTTKGVANGRLRVSLPTR